MRILILSDIHANQVALEAVLKATSQAQIDQLWCLGDTVGYGPNPNECVALMQQHAVVALAGNHDWGALEKVSHQEFNPHAQAALRWTGDQLSDSSREWLTDLSGRQDGVHPAFTLAHASPRDPIWEYILDAEIAAQNFPHFETRFALVGHTHQPAIFRKEDEDNLVAGYYPMPNHPIELGHDEQLRFIINPGSIGQPRDHDPRAAYAIFDDDRATLTFHRQYYDVTETQRRMEQVGLPDRLIQRLAIGW